MDAGTTADEADDGPVGGGGGWEDVEKWLLSEAMTLALSGTISRECWFMWLAVEDNEDDDENVSRTIDATLGFMLFTSHICSEAGVFWRFLDVEVGDGVPRRNASLAALVCYKQIAANNKNKNKNKQVVTK